MGIEQDLKNIISNPFGNYREWEDALQDLAALKTAEAEKALQEISEDVLRPEWLRTKAAGYLKAMKS